MPTVSGLLAQARDLSTANPRRDAEILLCHCLKKNRAWLYTWPDAEVVSSQVLHFSQLMSRRKRGVPIAHLTGVRDFWSLELQVNEHTLIPRAETETLVEWALELALPESASILDLGTGSGAIALALAKERPRWQLAGVDASADALKIAKANAESLGLSTVRFLQSNWFSSLPGEHFHLLVANPPYIEKSDPHLSQGDLPHEPQMALVADENGLADISHIVAAAPAHLHRDGWLLVEHGFDQGAATRDLFHSSGFFDVTTRRDLAGHERITGGCACAQ